MTLQADTSASHATDRAGQGGHPGLRPRAQGGLRSALLPSVFVLALVALLVLSLTAGSISR